MKVVVVMNNNNILFLFNYLRLHVIISVNTFYYRRLIIRRQNDVDNHHY